ncbi:MAG: mechanosensitive ion channel family protein [Rhizobiaceae bacterium]
MGHTFGRQSKFAVKALLFITLLLGVCFSVLTAQAQFIPQATTSQPETVTLPEKLDESTIDALLSRLTDSQIRDLLRDELVRQGEDATQAIEDRDPLIDRATLRLNQMAEKIDIRVRRWLSAIWNIGSRKEKINKRLELAENGFSGMLLAAALLVAGGFVSAFAVNRLTRNWQRWLTDVQNVKYWERVLRTIMFGIVELMPVAAFAIATQTIWPLLKDMLGPLDGLVWIYYIGVLNGWLFLVLARRTFAPVNPQIRIATISDQAAEAVYGTLKRVVIFGVTGWTAAGLFPNLGFGFPPALIAVALTGTVIAGYLIFKIAGNLQAIGNQIQHNFMPKIKNPAVARTWTLGLPVMLCLYILLAWIVWLLTWLEKGIQNLNGPIGTLIVLMFIPLFERFGRELIGTCIASEDPIPLRIKSVLTDAWRVLIAIVTIVFVFSLWGFDILVLTKGEDASVLASTIFDITITVLIGQLVWRLISAALHTEKRANAGGEDADPDAPGASRLGTLIPVFRNILLGILAIVIILIVLAAVGVDVGPLIASAGIVGIAIGFGAQALVRDIFSGIFFLIDDAFRVGEYIELEEHIMGEVESITIRSLQLRNHRGPVITIPFGELKQITNHSRDWVIYKMEFRLEPDTVPQHVKKIVKQVGAEFLEHPDHGPKFIEPLKSQGVKSIDDDSALIVRVKFKCLPRTQFVLRREIYHRLKVVFEENGIHFARRKIEVVGADGEPVEDKSKIAIPEDIANPSATPA